MNRIHVLHVTLFLKMGGLESIIMDIARNIDHSQFKISVLCLSSYDEKYKNIIEKLGVSVFHIKRENTMDISFFKKSVNLLKKENVHIIHAHSGCFFNIALCSKLAGIKNFVYTEHGLPIYDNGLPMNSGYKARLEDRFAACISGRIFAVSDEIKLDMINRFPKSYGKVRVLTNGVNTDNFKPVDDESYRMSVKKSFNIPECRMLIGSVGRLVPIKNYESLVDAFARLIKKHDNVHLILIGDGSERKKLELMVIEAGIGSYVTFAGVQYDIQNILPAFDVFVLPSWTEGTSISLLESQACGIPAVVTNVGGNPGIINNGWNGFLYEPDDRESMIVQLSVLLSDDELRIRMKTASRENVVTRYSVLNMVREYEKEYFEIMNSKHLKTGDLT